MTRTNYHLQFPLLFIGIFILLAGNNLYGQRRSFDHSIVPTDGLPTSRPLDLATAKLRLQQANKISDADGCRSETFTSRIVSGADQTVTLAGIQPSFDGSFSLAGTVSYSSGVYTGFFGKVTPAGATELTAFRVNSGSTTALSLGVLADGRLIMGGTFLENGRLKGYVSLHQPDFTLIWNRAFSFPQDVIKVTVDLSNDYNIFVAAHYGQDISCSSYDLTGTRLFNRVVKIKNLSSLIGFRNSYMTTATLVTNIEVAGKKGVNYTDMDPATGAVTRNHFSGAGAEEDMAGDTRNWYATMQNAKITRLANGNYVFRRTIQSNAQQIEYEHTWNIPGTLGWDVTSAMDNAGDIIGVCLPQDGQLVSIMHPAYGGYNTTHTRTYNVPVGSTIAALARSPIDGGFIMGVNAPDNKEILLIKTDSTGQTPGCGNGTLYLNGSLRSLIENSSVAYTTPAPALTPGTGTWAGSAASFGYPIDCHTQGCVPLPPEDTCMTSFQKTYRSALYGDVMGQMFQMENNNLLMMGGKEDRSLDITTYTGGLKLFDPRGNFVREATLFYDGKSTFGSLKQTDPRHVVMRRYSIESGVPATTITKFDLDLNITWSKTYKTNGVMSVFLDMTADDEGNMYFVTSDPGQPAGTPKFLVLKLDVAGNLLWTKTYHADATGFLQDAVPVIAGGSLVILSSSGTQISTMRIDRNTGEVLNGYRVDGLQLFPSQNFIGADFYNGKIYAVTTAPDFTALLASFDYTGKLLQLKKLPAVRNPATTFRDGGLYLGYINTDNNQEVLLKMDTALNPVYQNVQAGGSGGGTVSMVANSQGAVYVINSSYSGDAIASNYTRMLKYDFNGNLGTCSPIAAPPVQIIDVNFASVNRTFTQLAGSPFFNNGDIIVTTLPEVYGPRVNQLLCVDVPKCNSVSLTGPVAPCDTSLIYRYQSTRNAGCDLAVRWIYDTAALQLVRDLDGLLDVKFRKPGITMLIAELASGCKIYHDTLMVNAQNLGINTLLLGADKALCPAGTVDITPGTGYSSYLWSNGSTSETISVNTPGQYFVEVTNSCGATGYDTINITMATVPVLDLGADLQACVGDTVQLNASAGFMDYVWTGSMLNTNSGQSVYTIAGAGGSVGVTATTSDGCPATDAVMISTVLPTPVTLANDTTLCTGSTLSLDAGTGFNSYQWSTGSTAPAVVVSGAGTYWVEITDANGCRSRDSMTLQLNPLPVLNLGPDSDLCESTTRRLDAGSAAGYQWSDGSAGQYLEVVAPGTYWVKIISQQQCAASDTLVVRSIVPNPSNFLPAIDSVCSYNPISLKPRGNYTGYNWSTGSTTSAISVNQPGSYTLDVTDGAGCKGSDTILVLAKTCYTGIFVPTVFTPNADGINDVFKAGVWGNVLQFRFQVFNRWGQVVFQTTDVSKGWDGRVKGVAADAGVFVWQCTYNIQGQAPGFLKGTVNLIR